MKLGGILSGASQLFPGFLPSAFLVRVHGVPLPLQLVGKNEVILEHSGARVGPISEASPGTEAWEHSAQSYPLAAGVGALVEGCCDGPLRSCLLSGSLRLRVGIQPNSGREPHVDRQLSEVSEGFLFVIFSVHVSFFPLLIADSWMAGS